MSNLKVGDTVWCTVFVAGNQMKTGKGTIVSMSNDKSIAQVDVGSIHGCSPWLRWEATSHLIKEDPLFDAEYDATHQLKMKEKYELSY
jgi:hypothetical protein